MEFEMDSIVMYRKSLSERTTRRPIDTENWTTIDPFYRYLINVKNEKNVKTHRCDYLSAEQKEFQRIREANERAAAKFLAMPE